MGYIEKTNGVALEIRKEKARMKIGRGGRSLYNLNAKHHVARRIGDGVPNRDVWRRIAPLTPPGPKSRPSPSVETVRSFFRWTD